MKLLRWECLLHLQRRLFFLHAAAKQDRYVRTGCTWPSAYWPCDIFSTDVPAPQLHGDVFLRPFKIFGMKLVGDVTISQYYFKLFRVKMPQHILAPAPPTCSYAALLCLMGLYNEICLRLEKGSVNKTRRKLRWTSPHFSLQFIDKHELIKQVNQ